MIGSRRSAKNCDVMRFKVRKRVMTGSMLYLEATYQTCRRRISDRPRLLGFVAIREDTLVSAIEVRKHLNPISAKRLMRLLCNVRKIHRPFG